MLGTWCAKQLTPPLTKNRRQKVMYNKYCCTTAQNCPTNNKNCWTNAKNCPTNRQMLYNKQQNRCTTTKNCPTNCPTNLKTVQQTVDNCTTNGNCPTNGKKLSNKSGKLSNKPHLLDKFYRKCCTTNPTVGDLLYNRRLSVGKLYNRFLSA